MSELRELLPLSSGLFCSQRCGSSIFSASALVSWPGHEDCVSVILKKHGSRTRRVTPMFLIAVKITRHLAKMAFSIGLLFYSCYSCSTYTCIDPFCKP